MLPPDPNDDRVEIRCPRCGGRAMWEEPFAFSSRRKGAAEELERLVPWGGWLVREKFPSLIRWKAPARGQGYFYHQQGVVRCRACHLVSLHRLCWPEDAFFRWNVRGARLYALDEEHARVLLDYIGSRLRDPNRYGEWYRKGLQRLPGEVMDGHARERVAGQIAETLRAHGIPLGPPPLAGRRGTE